MTNERSSCLFVTVDEPKQPQDKRRTQDGVVKSALLLLCFERRREISIQS